MTIQVHSLHCYPIKSCQGIDMDSVELIATGIRYDRHWMLVDDHGQFLSQRQYPKMATVATGLTNDSLIINAPEFDTLELQVDQNDGDRIAVQIWKDRCSAAKVSALADQWFSDLLGVDCHLVFLPDTEQRLVDPRIAQKNETVGFADGFPLLVLSLASMELLNQKLQDSLDINRFRANIIISGCPANAEDNWASMTINGIALDLVKACSRCSIPGIDQKTAETHPQILETLASYRRVDRKVLMGQNAIHRRTGRITVGDSVTFTER